MQPKTNIANDVQKLSWYHPSIQRHHAEALLLQNGQDGSYLLRPSTSDNYPYSISVKCSDSVKHMQVGWDGCHFTFGMGRFSSITEFVEHFQNKPLVGGESGILTVLKHPYPRDVSEPISYETVRIHAEWGDRPSAKKEEAPMYSLNSKEGYLTKQGLHVKNWKTRWFVLVKNDLKYYKSKGENEPIRILDLRACIEVEEEFSKGKNNCFRIVMPSRTYYLYSTMPAEKQEWIQMLQWKLECYNNTA